MLYTMTSGYMNAKHRKVKGGGENMTVDADEEGEVEEGGGGR